jgi:hypothetical protein
MNIMLASPVATEKSQSPLQKRLRPAEAIYKCDTAVRTY